VGRAKWITPERANDPATILAAVGLRSDLMIPELATMPLERFGIFSYLRAAEPERRPQVMPTSVVRAALDSTGW
jgi:hypothetical protein